MAQLTKLHCPGDWNFHPGEDSNVYFARTKKLLNDLCKEAEKVDENVSLIGAVVKWSVADGYAFYRVVKDKPLTLQHIPYGDGYMIPQAMMRGIRREDILKQIEFDRFWKNQKT